MKKWYAITRWSVEDVIAAAEKQGIHLTKEKAQKWLENNEQAIRNLLIEHGLAVLAEMDFSEVK